MKSTLIILAIAFACTAIRSGAEERKIPNDLWKLIAKSDTIAIGELHYEAVKGTDEYVSLEFDVTKELKSTGPNKGKIEIRFYDRNETHADIIRHFKELSSKPSLVFAVQIDDPAVEGLYLAGIFSESVFPSTPEVEAAIDRELGLQARIVRDFEPDNRAPHFKLVERLLASIVDADSQQNAFSDLEALGEEAVPAIVAQMNDFRELPNSGMTLKNSPGHWEAVRHYGPDKVVDAMAAILNQLTHQSYRAIYNGGSDRERKACIDAWRVHVHHAKNGAEQDATEQPAPAAESK
jgi:hypothetical protein